MQKNEGKSRWNKKKSDQIDKVGVNSAWEGRKTQRSPRMDHATFSIGISTILGLKDKKNPIKTSTFDSRNDSKVIKDQSRLKTEEAPTSNSKQYHPIKIKPFGEQTGTNSLAKYPRPFQNKSFLVQSNGKTVVKETCRNDQPSFKKSSIKTTIFRFNSKPQTQTKTANFEGIAHQAQNNHRPSLANKNQPIACFVKRLPDKDPVENSVGPQIDHKKTLTSSENEQCFNAFDTLQKTSYNHYGNMEEHSGIIYASIPTNDKNIKHNKSRDSRTSKFSYKKNLSFNECRRNTFKTVASIDKKMRLSLLEPQKTSNKRDAKPSNINFDKKIKPLVFHTENEFRAPGLESRLESLPNFPSKYSNSNGIQTMSRCGRLKKRRISSSQPNISGVLRTNNSLKELSETSNLEAQMEISQKASSRCILRESGQREVEFLRNRMKSLENRLGQSNQELNILQKKHKELSGVFLRVVSENVTLKMINQQERLDASGRDQELRSCVEKIVADLIWPDLDQSETPKKQSQFC